MLLHRHFTAAASLRSVVLAQKFFDEICYKSEFYGSFNKLSVWQINGLEVEFLCRIHFSLAVFSPEFLSFYNRLRAFCASSPLRESSRGWCVSPVGGVSIPEIVNMAPVGCPLLKYVFSPQEQQRKEAFYRQREQRQAQLRLMPPVPAPILLLPSQPYPLRHHSPMPDCYPHPPHPGVLSAPSIPVAPPVLQASSVPVVSPIPIASVAPVAPVASVAPVAPPATSPYCLTTPIPGMVPVVETYSAPPIQKSANERDTNGFVQYPYEEMHYPAMLDRNAY